MAPEDLLCFDLGSEVRIPELSPQGKKMPKCG